MKRFQATALLSILRGWNYKLVPTKPQESYQQWGLIIIKVHTWILDFFL